MICCTHIINYLYLVALKSILFEINKVKLIFQRGDTEIAEAYNDIVFIQKSSNLYFWRME